MDQQSKKMERRVTDPRVKNCDSCLRYAAQGWQPLGTLPKIGTKCECRGNCKCRMEYSDATSPDATQTTSPAPDNPDGAEPAARLSSSGAEPRARLAAAQAVLAAAPDIPVTTQAASVPTSDQTQSPSSSVEVPAAAPASETAAAPEIPAAAPEIPATESDEQRQQRDDAELAELKKKVRTTRILGGKGIEELRSRARFQQSAWEVPIGFGKSAAAPEIPTAPDIQAPDILTPEMLAAESDEQRQQREDKEDAFWAKVSAPRRVGSPSSKVIPGKMLENPEPEIPATAPVASIEARKKESDKAPEIPGAGGGIFQSLRKYFGFGESPAAPEIPTAPPIAPAAPAAPDAEKPALPEASATTAAGTGAAKSEAPEIQAGAPEIPQASPSVPAQAAAEVPATELAPVSTTAALPPKSEIPEASGAGAAAGAGSGAGVAEVPISLAADVRKNPARMPETTAAQNRADPDPRQALIPEAGAATAHGGAGGGFTHGAGTGVGTGGDAATKELTTAIKELTAAVKKLTEVTEKQARSASGGKTAGMSGTSVAGGGAKNAFDMAKKAVANSGNAMIGRAGGSNVARTGAAMSGGAAEGAGAVAGGASTAASAGAAEAAAVPAIPIV